MLGELLKQHSDLHNKVNVIISKYKENVSTIKFALSTPEEIKIAKKNIKKLDNQYQKLREDIYDIEDEIYEIDQLKGDEIVRPLSEDLNFFLD